MHTFLNNKELDARIHNFMDRKLQEHPDLQEESTPHKDEMRDVYDAPDRIHSNKNITMHWHLPRLSRASN